MTTLSAERPAPVAVVPWPSEGILRLLVAFAAIVLWGLLIVTIFGAVYALIIGLALFVGHLLFITHLRGNAVRLGPEQFPELYSRVQQLAQRAGISLVPAAYLMEAGGSLNALATRFLRSRIIVLYSDLLDACEGNEGARDMVIGHELGHIKQGHLDYWWLLAPGRLVPFLGAAYSRACEYTCDRYGRALCGDHEGALTGLLVLAAGKYHGPRVNRRAFVAQRADLDTGLMTFGRWLSGYPPLCDRVAALDAELAAGAPRFTKGPLRALMLVGVFALLPPAGIAAMLAIMIPNFKQAAAAIRAQAEAEAAAADEGEDEGAVPLVVDHGAATTTVSADAERLLVVLRRHHRAGNPLPADVDALETLWQEHHPDQPWPLDPYDGLGYGYVPIDQSTVRIWSSGPDRESGTEDDVSAVHRVDVDD